jgi:hypothetical protein
MLFHLNSNTIEQTTCPDNFKCLQHTHCGMCQVERRIPGNNISVSGDGRESCHYRSMAGLSFICNCPVRIELYDRYGL